MRRHDRQRRRKHQRRRRGARRNQWNIRVEVRVLVIVEPEANGAVSPMRGVLAQDLRDFLCDPIAILGPLGKPEILLKAAN